MTVVDVTTGHSVNRLYTISVTAPAAPTLPSPNPITLPSATVTQNYTGSINATDNVGSSFTWTINGSTTLNNGNSTSLGNGLTATANGEILNIAGNAGSTTAVNFTAKITDNTDSLSSTTQSYSITVNPNGSTVSGTVFLSNTNCGSSNVLAGATIGIYNGNTLVASGTTGINGTYSIDGIPDGTYTIVPSITGPSSSLFTPVNYTSVTLSSSGTNNVSGKDFNSEVGYTITGTVSYSGTQTGQTYIRLNGGCGGNGGSGTTFTGLTGNGSYIIRGVQPGSFTVQAWMDPLGQAAQNSIDPTGGTSITVTTASETNVVVTMHDPRISRRRPRIPRFSRSSPMRKAC